jgi:hypothetical protein
MARCVFYHRHPLISASTTEWRLYHANDHLFRSAVPVRVVTTHQMSSERLRQQKSSMVPKDPLAAKGELHEQPQDA